MASKRANSNAIKLSKDERLQLKIRAKNEAKKKLSQNDEQDDFDNKVVFLSRTSDSGNPKSTQFNCMQNDNGSIEEEDKNNLLYASHHTHNFGGITSNNNQETSQTSSGVKDSDNALQKTSVFGNDTSSRSPSHL